MRELEDGLYECAVEMPCSPKDIRVWRYTLPSTLNRAEREEAAARILFFSQELDSWVGVSWPRLVQVMREDLQQFEAIYSGDNQDPDANPGAPFTILPVLGPNAIVDGIHELEEQEMLRLETIGEGDDQFDVVFPLPKLIERIMEVQGVTPRVA